MVQSVRQYSELAEGRAEGQGQADAERDYGGRWHDSSTPPASPEVARLFSSTLFGAPPSHTPDATIADADLSLGWSPADRNPDP
ncbi:hypothetical protein GCM10011576_31550 [Micromonospora parathelypteridis]|uniref:Uncharacterized protein n=1 Tax=Micromonospora parathelypteridis TaxID=1839617 RepID=A0A840VSC7_9ACTN|nr:hypothetical protein [Micromonospora parathelypteridis]MBB5476894.1 hypothetical protein [Micromonospora parathelypteridis]GGO17543.1 hypothetical protein GCM10011576_31550 [Micromonospora parathelypteridis]